MAARSGGLPVACRPCSHLTMDVLKRSRLLAAGRGLLSTNLRSVSTSRAVMASIIANMDLQFIPVERSYLWLMSNKRRQQGAGQHYLP